MNNDSIKNAIKEAEAFISKANKHIEETSKTYTHGDYTFNVSSPKTGGSLRRQSMELTRALAEMRKP